MNKIIIKNNLPIQKLVLLEDIYENVKDKDFENQNFIKINNKNFKKELKYKYDYYSLFMELEDEIEIGENEWFTIKFPVKIDFEFNSNRCCFFKVKNNKIIVDMFMKNYFSWNLIMKNLNKYKNDILIELKR